MANPLPAGLEAALSLYDMAHLECDGLTRVLHTILARENIPHTVWMGRLSWADKAVTHFWIKLATGETVDYRARMWLGPQAPHGIFRAEETEAIYLGHQIEMDILPEWLFNLLLNNG